MPWWPALLCLLGAPWVSAQGQGQNTAIDFSGGEVQADGSVCVVVEEEQEKLEQGTEQQCTQQILTQCYNSYVTTYKDVVKEKCIEVFVKTCRIKLVEKGFNATTRVCKRPLVKECNEHQPTYGGYGAPGYGAPEDQPEPNIICRNLYETQCNTTHQVPLGGGPSLPVTSCDQVKRKICAEDNCRVVEGEEECHEKVVPSTVEVPNETCNMAPEEECKNVTTSVPQLLPEQACRQVPKEVCQTVFLNPRNVKTTVPVKYCTNPNTGIVEQQDDAEDFDGINPRSPRTEPLQLQEEQLAVQTALPLRKKGGRRGHNRNRDKLLRGGRFSFF